MSKYKPGWSKDIKIARKNRSMTQEDLADLAGVSRSTIVKIEKGNTKVALENYLRIMEFLNLQPPQRLNQLHSGIIFDVDDTLVDRQDIPVQLGRTGKELVERLEKGKVNKLFPLLAGKTEKKIKELREKLKEIMFGKAWIKQQYGNPISWFMEEWISMNLITLSHPEKEEVVGAAVEKYYDRIEETVLECDLCNGVKETLDFLHQEGLSFAAMSNSSHGAVEGILKKKGLLEYFEDDSGEPIIIGGDDIEKSPEAVETALDRMGLAANNAYVVGDTAGDIEAGKKAGIQHDKAILLKREYQNGIRKSSIGGFEVLDSFSDLKKYIEEREIA